MNYLAHIYLSFDDPAIQAGNFMADFIKGDEYLKYPQGYQVGVKIHRKIDRFTDTHPLVAKTRGYFFEEFRHYASVIVDVLFDHLLAKHWTRFSDKSLETFINEFYVFMEENLTNLPRGVQRIFPIMKQHNWLYNYRSLDGIQQILFQMNQRTSSKPGLHKSIPTLIEHLPKIEAYFFAFFEELNSYVGGLKNNL